MGEGLNSESLYSELPPLSLLLAPSRRPRGLISSKHLPTPDSHVYERRFQLARKTSPTELLGGHDLRPAAGERLEADVAGLGVFAHGPGEDLHRLLRGVLVADDSGFTFPVNIPDRRDGVVAIVLGSAAYGPAHHARLMLEVPI